MLDSIRRHQKWLWMVIVVATILSFVWYLGPAGSNPGGGQRAAAGDIVGSIYGEPLRYEAFQRAQQEAVLRFRMYSGTWPNEDQSSRMLFNEEREVRDRLLISELMERFDVKVSHKSVADWIERTFRDRGEFRIEIYQGFLKLIGQRGYTEQDFVRFAQHQVGFEHLVSIFGIAGKFVTPQEAETRYRQENEQLDTQVAFFALTNYLASVNLDAAALQKFYQEQQANYRLPDRVQVSYVKFDATNFTANAEERLSKITNLTQRIDEAYRQSGTNLYPGLAPEVAKAKIRDEERHRIEILLAHQKANEFIETLLDKQATVASFETLASTNGLPVQTTQPFTRFEGPIELNAPSEFAQIAFALTEADPVAERAIVGDDAVYVIALKGKVPSQIQPFEAVKDKVTEDYRRSEAQKLVRQAGDAFYSAVVAGTATGKTFQVVAAEQKVNLIDLPPFAQKTPMLIELPNRNDFGAVKGAAFNLSPTNTVTTFTSTRDGGFVLNVQARVPVDDAKVKSELPQFTKTLQQSRQTQAFSEWLRKEAELAKVMLPYSKDDRDEAAF